MISPKILLTRAWARLNVLFGRGLVISVASILIVCLAVSAGAFLFLNTAAPRSLTISSGPAGSTFHRTAEKYQKILAREGVRLKILPSDGSTENLRRLADPKSGVDIGFVLGGAAGDKEFDQLMSLGSVSYQPLMIFYRGEKRELLSQFKGKRLNVGPAASGPHDLALRLLKANGIVPGADTILDETDFDDPGKELREGRVDAVFLMGDSTASAVMRKLMRDGDVRLFSFVQTDAYVRRVRVLNKLLLPRGGLDLGLDLPPEDVYLVGPTVQLVARESLHPALSDLLLEAAREVHGTASLFRKRGEFPAAQEGDFRISADATRYYASGKSFLYGSFPFWLASLIARVLAFLVPVVLLLLPALKFAPMIYRWRIESRIYRWYQVLLELEREANKPPLDAARHAELLRQLDHIESAVNRIVIPATFGDLFYGLRGHINFVRQNLLAHPPPDPADAPA
ncbi:MAG: C4-dicarboxylate ABC transporter substrate-binding protein [Rhodocyclales bacterium]|nr:C4-dicarboxylate ABC transporter substrate-binding protein [Rhodocyclales bacterium]